MVVDINYSDFSWSFYFHDFFTSNTWKKHPESAGVVSFFFLVEVSWLMFLFLHCCRFPLDNSCIFFCCPKKSRVEIHEAKNSTFFHPTNHHPSNHHPSNHHPSNHHPSNHHLPTTTLPTIPGRWLRVRPARPSVWWIPSVWLLRSGAGLSMRWSSDDLKLWENLLFF